MSRVQAILLADLRHTIRDLGADGALTSGSVYDTAQVLRLAPPAQGVWPALEWLIAQQRPDGGWGDPWAPRARDLPTLAALMALHLHDTRQRAQEVVRSGLAFLRRQAMHWVGALPEDLTAGVELLLPRLLAEAHALGLDISPEPYQALSALGKRRRQLIAQLKPKLGSTAFHSWEAWGSEPEPHLLDGIGSVGHSPAATAYWLSLAAGRVEPAMLAAAHNYLVRAANAIDERIPGVVPTCWPTPHFERVFALHALYLGELLDSPALADLVQPQIERVHAALGPGGVGFSDYFAPDGDDTAAAIALLHARGYNVSMSPLKQFAVGDHYCAWPGELQASLSVTAHVTHTLLRRGEPTKACQTYMLERQLSDGRWPGDKWNSSWLYTTWRVIVALLDAGQHDAVERAAGAILAYQHPNGSWGTNCPNSEETAYAVLTLRRLGRAGRLSNAGQAALRRADRWLLQDYSPFKRNPVNCWLAKEPYGPTRISRAIVLTALLSAPGTILATT